ncbi:hypothetical protein GE061_014809 [Apolygus lucorum]|uniref:Uncharacterized protein n=1 Tax=Apolygus lucorum TaxID=248454 RepID=A0A6A4J0P6_APOLU|nr:hypothetical protein GE061_014809 [Apolygus lucorum]
MWGSTAILLVTVVSISAFDFQQGHFTNLEQRLNDPSWSLGFSNLVGVGANNSCSAIFSCADCNTAKVCRPSTNGSLSIVKAIPCPSTAPYCQYSTGTCGTVPDDSCGHVDNFICLADGRFPDANCSAYHVCDGLTPHKFECKIKGQTYNADNQRCEASNTCSTFNCDGTGKKVANSIYPSYFAYCTNNTQLPLVIDRCTGINQLNSTSQLCEPICTEEGVLQDIEDCTKYYKCSYLWIDDTTKFMTRQRLDCPTNTGFDPSNFICVSLTQIPTCKASAPKMKVQELLKL